MTTVTPTAETKLLPLLRTLPEKHRPVHLEYVVGEVDTENDGSTDQRWSSA